MCSIPKAPGSFGQRTRKFRVYEYTGVLSDYVSVIRLERETSLILRKYDVDTMLLHPDGPPATYLGQIRIRRVIPPASAAPLLVPPFAVNETWGE
jgi:hypothetical protein